MDFAYNEYIDFFGKYLAHYRELLTFENKKFSLVLEDNIPQLEKALEDEQALIMRGDILEKKRLKLQLELGLADKSFEEIIAICPEQYKLKFAAINQELSAVVFEIKKINLLGNELVRDKLEKINKITNSNNIVQPYNKSGTVQKYGSTGGSYGSKTI